MSLAFIIGKFVTIVPAWSTDTREILDGHDIYYCNAQNVKGLRLVTRLIHPSPGNS